MAKNLLNNYLFGCRLLIQTVIVMNQCIAVEIGDIVPVWEHTARQRPSHRIGYRLQLRF